MTLMQPRHFVRLALTGLLWGATVFSSATAQSIVQTFFIPFDEDEVNIALNTIDNFGGNIGSTLRSSISIVGGITNTVIYWDHWEDGYEASIMSPTQTTTVVWGDNNPLNGLPPGFVLDRVGEGDIITLTNDIPIPRDASDHLYDSRDRMSVTRWVAVSRYLYAPSPGEVLADSAQIIDRSKYGFEFRTPVGINTGTNQMFEYSSFHLAAGYDSTVVQIDGDADGVTDETVHLNAGENHVVRFTSEGARAMASKPIQAHMITGDIGSNYEMRFFELFPNGQWDTNYFASVHSISNIFTEVYLFNPHPEAMNITCRTLYTTSIVAVAANHNATYIMPTNSGANFYSTNGLSFIPVSATDARQAISGNQAYDWGHALVPVRALTTVTIVPWAPGAGGDPMASRNGNPVWVTAESNTTLHVDLDGDSTTGPLLDAYGRHYDFATNILALQSIRIADNTDNDQTGMRIYTLDGTKFATVWGQDPSVALTGNPYLDMGAAVFPFPTVPAVKNWSLENDLNTNGVVNPGDAIKFTIHVVNVGYSDADNVVMFDTGASNTTYNPGSTFVNETNILDDAVPPFETGFPFDEFGYNLGFIPIGKTSTVAYTVTVADPFPTNTDGVVNGVYVDNQTQVFVPVPVPGFLMEKTAPTNVMNPSDTFTYTLDIISTANVYQTGIQISDTLPAGLTYVTNSARVIVTGEFTGSFLDRFAIDDEYDSDDGALLWGTDWLELGESDGPGLGDIRITTDAGASANRYMLRLQNANRGAYRIANTQPFTNILLHYEYRRESLEAGDAASVAVSANGGTSWTVLTNLSGAATDAGYIAVSNINVTAFRSTNFAVRFLGGGTLDTGDRVWIDNVEVTASAYNPTNIGRPPPTLALNYNLMSNQTMRITFDVTIDGNISSSSIVNRAYINSYAAPSPLEASVTNYVLLPDRSRIGGWVRNDLDGQGDTGIAYPGIANVSLTLYTDPNLDGNPDDGVVVASAYTDTNGFFELGYFLSNSYVIMQTDLVNYRSTADSDGGHSNLISLITQTGVDFTNHVFLDTQLASVAGQVRFDTDGDGDMADEDDGIAGATLTLFTDPNGDGDPADGAAVTARVSNASGFFSFDTVSTGQFVLVETDLNGTVSTADSEGINDNRIPLYLPGGLDSLANVFLDTSSGLSITKSSTPPGIWFDNLQARYEIIVVNTGQFTHTDINVTDTMSDGLSFIPGSLSLSGQPTNYMVVLYTNVGAFTFTPPNGVTQIEYLVVGGGGGGGGISSGSMGGGGGGGAGGLRSNIGGSPYAVVSGQTYTGFVGAGGAGGVGGSYAGRSGGTSIFATVTARGGGGGASYGGNSGIAGGSGGGGRLNTSGVGGAGTAGEGRNGGSGASSGSSAGGGGGASSVGTNGLAGGLGGHGGAGASNNITGAWQLYAGGGGGGGYGNTGGSGGVGGGASAPATRAAGNNGDSNTGGGGSGATGSSSGNPMTGGAGGSGLVVIRYATGFVADPPSLGTAFTLGPGELLRFVFTAEVFAATSVTNTACVVSHIVTEPLCYSVVNSVSTGVNPNRISGQIRFDPDGDGDLADTDPGLFGVTVALHSDPNGDGDPADGVVLDTTETDFRGDYIFGSVLAGHYVLVETDPSGHISTGDSQGANDNRIAVTLTEGIDSFNHVFLDWSISGLTIAKISHSDEIVVPSEVFGYSIIVSNTRSITAAGVTIIDDFPDGLAAIPGSTRIYISGAIISNSVIDAFNGIAYTNQNGSEAWLDAWVEAGDDGSPASGDIACETDLGSIRLRVRDDDQSISRRADISTGTSATLSYFYRRSGLEADEYMVVEISADNAAPWIELARHGHQPGGAATQSDASYKSMHIDISAFISTNTTIRLRTPSGGMADGDMVYVDDVRIDHSYSEVISMDGPEPPHLVTDIELLPHAYVMVSFTTQVTSADFLVNTAAVYTLTDTNGVRCSVTNFVGDITMTQGVVVVTADGAQGVHLGWTAYTNEQGEITKDYEILYADDSALGFCLPLTNRWASLTMLNACTSVDTGSVTRVAPGNLGNSLRFYRTSFKNAWSADRPTRYATKEIYVAKAVSLKEGENFISLFMVPDDNRLAAILGTNRLPAGNSIADSTRIEWYATTAQSEATNVVWLSNAGLWLREEGGSADDMAIPLCQSFNLIIPPGAGNPSLVLVGRVPTNTCAVGGHSIPVAGNLSYNLTSYNLPYRVKLKDSGLKAAGFSGVAPGVSFNPNNSDELRILRKGGGSMQTPLFRILLNANGQFQYWSGGSGVADELMLEPDYALILYTRKSTNDFIWNLTLPYPEPTVTISP